MKAIQKQIELSNLDVTKQLAAKLASALLPGTNIFLYGDLGAGKTTLVRDVLAALGHNGVTKSPTYTLVETYNLGSFTIHHFDLYRLADPQELEFIGIREYFDASAVCFIEWPQKGLGYVPEADLEINLELHGLARSAALTAKSIKGEQILKRMGPL